MFWRFSNDRLFELYGTDYIFSNFTLFSKKYGTHIRSLSKSNFLRFDYLVSNKAKARTAACSCLISFRMVIALVEKTEQKRRKDIFGMFGFKRKKSLVRFVCSVLSVSNLRMIRYRCF